MARSENPLIVVLSGPSGVGKDAVLSRMKQLGYPYHFTVTATSRTIRPGETDGVDYIFVSKETFSQMADADGLLESANVYGNMYGIPRNQVTKALEAGQDVVVKIDVQGAATIRKILPDALFIFLAAPEMSDVASRLKSRMTESPEALQRRLDTALKEMEEAPKFDFIVYNREGRIDDAAREIGSIIDRERTSRG
ncbi:MAG: guanylate kinase [SAR202 cluster bacterium]|jgi:guanylate kinase|nr:guanylate kinase [SAR202 cluster bacterium]|tara:strand:- start:244 stop:828 length:585 start_codon:yes stop_codon:yes gene_type:complete